MNPEHEKRITARLQREEGFRLRVSFADEATGILIVDEPPPLGEGAGPTGAELLASAVGTCLSQSLLFCLQRSRVPVASLETDVEATVARNDKGRLRVARIEVRLSPVLVEESEDTGAASRFTRCIGMFQQFCTVAESIGEAIPIEVTVMETGASRAASV